jgi:hypothetical protein
MQRSKEEDDELARNDSGMGILDLITPHPGSQTAEHTCFGADSTRLSPSIRLSRPLVFPRGFLVS